MALANTSGWWNCVRAADLDNDGDIDFVAGNLGENAKFKADKDHPAKLYINDFDNNGTKECIITLFKQDGKEYPYNMRPDLTTQLPALKKKFLKYAAYAGKTIEEVITQEQLNTSELKQANEFRSCAFFNNGKGVFTKIPLPKRAQFSPIYALLIDDIDKDGFKDIVAAGNFYGLKPELGRYDANYGSVFLGNGKSDFTYLSSQQSGFFYLGEARDMKMILTGSGKSMLLTRNNDKLKIFKVSTETSHH